MNSSGNGTFILGAGATGLAAGFASGYPVFEAAESPGGICSTYYISSDGTKRTSRRPDENDYRFEPGGGHWLWGTDESTLNFLSTYCNLKSYFRQSGVWFPDHAGIIPFPLQYHLSKIPREIGVAALQELLSASPGKATTAREQFYQTFGPTLCNFFFEPFHRLYTAGLWDRIAPQDEYKSPIDKDLVARGFQGEHVTGGYNISFRYPLEGLGEMFRRLSAMCDVRYGRTVTRIDVRAKEIRFSNGGVSEYDRIISTLPLVTMTALTGVKTESKPDPYTSVLVLNIGGKKGSRCPEEHWLYIPHGQSGFHRVGLYSNVDVDFLPKPVRNKKGVSLYVEKAYRAGEKPSPDEIENLCHEIIAELISWKFLAAVDVVDPTWIDVAYTWSYPGSTWKEDLTRALQDHSIIQAGRYARWHSRGIVDSVREGLEVGASMRKPH